MMSSRTTIMAASPPPPRRGIIRLHHDKDGGDDKDDDGNDDSSNNIDDSELRSLASAASKRSQKNAASKKPSLATNSANKRSSQQHGGNHNNSVAASKKVRGGSDGGRGSGLGSSRSNGSNRGNGEQVRIKEIEQEARLRRMQRKTKIALMIRLMFAFLLFGSAVLAAVLVFMYTTNVEKREFENQFKSDAEKVLESIGNTFDDTLAAADTFITMVVAHKDATNVTFPFVALSNYALQAAKVKTLSKAYATGLHYIVQEDEREEWEKFAAENNEFVREAWIIQAQDKSFQGELGTFPKFQDQLFATVPEFYVRPKGEGPYLVTWQNYPIVFDPTSAPYNYDIFAVPLLARRWIPVLENKQPSVSGFSNVIDPNEPLSNVDKATVEHVRNFVPPDESPAEPFITLIYPIIDQNTRLKVDADRVNNDQLVGTLSFSIFWRDLLRNILPDNGQGIVVVTETACAQVFTYEINGSETKYLSNTDVHDSKFDYLEVRTTFSSLLDAADSPGKQSFYTGVPLSDATCPITIKIYPAQQNEGFYISEEPRIFAVTAGLIFVLAGGLFLLYGYLVDLRRREKTSEQSSETS